VDAILSGLIDTVGKGLSPKEQKLLLALGARNGQIVPADLLSQEIWPGRQANRRGTLNVLVHALRKRIGPSIETHDAGYSLNLSQLETQVLKKQFGGDNSDLGVSHRGAVESSLQQASNPEIRSLFFWGASALNALGESVREIVPLISELDSCPIHVYCGAEEWQALAQFLCKLRAELREERDAFVECLEGRLTCLLGGFALASGQLVVHSVQSKSLATTFIEDRCAPMEAAFALEILKQCHARCEFARGKGAVGGVLIDERDDAARACRKLLEREYRRNVHEDLFVADQRGKG
jgi:hypothetical protein